MPGSNTEHIAAEHPTRTTLPVISGGVYRKPKLDTPPGSTMSVRKSVTAQQLFGSKSTPPPPPPPPPPASCQINKRHFMDPSTFDSYRSSSRDLHSSMLQSQSQQHSHSYTTLPKSDFHGSYTVIPTTAAAPPKSSMAACQHRLYSSSSRYCSNHQHQFSAPPSNSCCLYNIENVTPAACTCDHYLKQYQVPSQLPAASFLMVNDGHRKSYANGCYSACEAHRQDRLTDEEDSAFPGLLDREFHILHHNVPALRRSGVDTTAIRQHFYPDGGWGWIICSVSFMAHILTTGLQLSYGLLLYYAITQLKLSGAIEWLGALSWSISMLVTPFVVAFCRKKLTRLLAVVGGLVLSLGILFTSFATQSGQILFSYGIVCGVGVAMIRESSSIMLGNYFKKRRQFVEMVAMSGEGVGIALFSVILKEGVGKMGWRLGLQIIAALVSINFFMGLLYRPASLYHPQRRAIQHLKNQRKKVREKKLPTHTGQETPTHTFILDFTPMKSTTVKIILLSSSVASLGIYAPIFLMSINAFYEKSDVQDLVLLQTFLGMSTALGVVLAGTVLRRPFRIRNIHITTQVISQVFISTIAVSILFLSFVMDYKGKCILSWIYGIGFGGFRYSIKILALERIKVKHFTKAWGLIKGAESLPVIIGIPLTSFLNDYSPMNGRAGYYICSAAAAIAGIAIFFISYAQTNGQNRKLVNGRISKVRSPPHHYKPTTADYFHNGWDYPVIPDLVHTSCINLNQADVDKAYRNRVQCERVLHQQHPCHHFVERNADLGFDSLNRQTASQYHFGQGSVGARAGRRLQKSLSFIHYPYDTSMGNDPEWFCNFRPSPQHQCDCRLRYQQQQQQQHQHHQHLVCTCSPNSRYNQSFKSRSVPEGLSSMSQQCSCSEISTTTKESTIFSTMPTTTTHSQARGIAPPCGHCHIHEPSSMNTGVQRPPYLQHRHRQRSQSLSKPFHFVEQITTSV